MKKIQFMDTSFRDGIQSYFGGRVLTEDIIPAIEAAADAGIDHFEVAGGGRFQSLPIYCNESPFDMINAFKKAAGEDVKLQSLSSGANTVALQAQPKDIIDLHAKLLKKYGITHTRNFDALNDVQNLEYSAECILKHGLHHQVSITMMELPSCHEHTRSIDYYTNTLKRILNSGISFNSLCYIDAFGTTNPKKLFEIIKAARKIIGSNITIWFHTHATAGLGELQNLSAIEAGVDGICVSRSPVSGGASQVDLLTMDYALKGTGYTFNVDHKKIIQANNIFKHCLKDYFFPPEALSISPEVIYSPFPGGALTANTMMMRDTGTIKMFYQVIEEMKDVMMMGGRATSVTPISQYYFQQAFANVTSGKWSTITEGYGKLVLGHFGKTPSLPNRTIIEKASKQLKLSPEAGYQQSSIRSKIPTTRGLLKENNLPTTEENIFIAATLATEGGNKGLDFLLGKSKRAIYKNIDSEIGFDINKVKEELKPWEKSVPAWIIEAPSTDLNLLH